MSLLDGEPRSATVVADTAVRLLVIHRRDFMSLLREVPALTQQMLVTLCQRVRTAEKALNTEQAAQKGPSASLAPLAAR